MARKKAEVVKGDNEECLRTSLLIDEETGYFAEQIYTAGSSCFCVYNVKTGETTLVDQIENNGFIIKPLEGEEIGKRAIYLPSAAQPYGTEEELDEKIRTYINKWLDIPPDLLQFAIWNIKRSWVYERFHTLNYLRALGDTGQGKTRFLDTLGIIHYKPILTSGATTAAPVFRIIDKWRGTMIFDEGDFKQTEETEALVKILNMGYEKGKFIMRCDQNNAEAIHFFDPYCPKIIATRKTFLDKAVESRCFTQVMTGTRRRDIPRNLNDNFYKEAEEIRNMLLMYRFRNYHKIDPLATVDFDFGIVEPRVQQIVTSFISLFSQNKEQLEAFKAFIQKHQEDLIEERQDSFDGSIVIAIHDLLEEGRFEFDAKEIIEKGELTDWKGNLMKPRGLSSPLKSLGFEKSIKKRIGDKTKRIIPLKQEHLNELFDRYGVARVTVVTVLKGTEQNNNIYTEQYRLKDFEGGGGSPYISSQPSHCHNEIEETDELVGDRFQKLDSVVNQKCKVCNDPVTYEDVGKGGYVCDLCKEWLEKGN